MQAEERKALVTAHRGISMGKILKYVLYMLLFLSLSILTAFLIYVHFFRSDDRNLSGEWTAQLDMTKQAAVTAFIWLQDIEGVSVSLEELESDMQDLTITVNMTMEQTGQSEGSFSCAVQPESYAVCEQAAYEAFAAVFRKLSAERLRMAGYADSADEESVEILINESFGMSAVSYLKTCAPALLPSLEELQAGYDGSGTYEAADGVLVRRYDRDGTTVTRSKRYIRKDSSLVLFEEAGVDISDVTDVSGTVSDYYPVEYTLKRTE